MDRAELLRQFYELSETEQKRKVNPALGPSSFYAFLEDQGFREANGVYHMPSIYLNSVQLSQPKSLRERIQSSPYQSQFRLHKATRFAKEPMSYADFLCIRYVYSGQVEIETQSSRFTLEQNDILLMNAGFVLSQHLSHEEDVAFTLMFEKDYLTQKLLSRWKERTVVSRFMYSYVLQSDNPKNYILFHGGDNDRLPRLMEDFVLEYIHPRELGENLLESYLQILLTEMTRSPYEYDQNRESVHSLHMAEILSEIDQNYQQISLQELAEKYRYHPDYISRQIRTMTGRSFKDYVLWRRMEQVCALLKNSELPISEIEQRAGFQNESYFYKKFRELFHMSPKEYRG